MTYDEWKKTLDEIPPQHALEYIRGSLATKDMLHVFGTFLFPEIIRGDSEVPECHTDLIRELTDPIDSAIIFPRGFSKSTWEKIDTLHDIVYNLEPVILYVSRSFQDAQFHFESMKSELENNDMLIAIYGFLVPDEKQLGRKWTNAHFETTNGVNVVARGAGKGRGVNIKNQRPTKIILDDIEDDEVVRSADRRRKLHDWIYNVIWPSKDKVHGRMKMIGTVIHPECELLKFYNSHGGLFRRAIENEQSIWSDMWPVEDLQRLRDGYLDEQGKRIEGIGTRAFSQEYLNEPIDDTSSIFKRAWLDTNIYREMPELAKMTIVMAVDPNAGQSEMADYMGIVVMGLSYVDKKRYILEARQEKNSLSRQIEIIDEVFEKWKPSKLGIEKVMNQTAMYQILLDKRKYPLVALSPEGKDKVNRAHKLEPFVENGTILFNIKHSELYYQMIQFPLGAHDDIVDALLYANDMLAQNSVRLSQEAAPMITAGLMTKKF